MTDKELKKLKRVELLEILVELRKKLDEADEENKRLREELAQTREGLAASTEKMVRRIYEERFGPFDPGPEAPAEEKADE